METKNNENVESFCDLKTMNKNYKDVTKTCHLTSIVNYILIIIPIILIVLFQYKGYFATLDNISKICFFICMILLIVLGSVLIILHHVAQVEIDKNIAIAKREMYNLEVRWEMVNKIKELIIDDKINDRIKDRIAEYILLGK